jgi:hypothetical protein
MLYSNFNSKCTVQTVILNQIVKNRLQPKNNGSIWVSRYYQPKFPKAKRAGVYRVFSRCKQTQKSSDTAVDFIN